MLWLYLSLSLSPSPPSLNLHWEICLLILERERNIDVRKKHWLVASSTCSDQGANLTLGMCPDWESNLQLFGEQDDDPTNWASYFQPFSSPGTHKLITKILQHTKIYFVNLKIKSKYHFDSFTSDSYGVHCCHFLIRLSKGKEVSAPD